MDPLPLWLKKPGYFLLFFACIASIILIGAGNLRFEGSYKTFFDADNPQMLAFDDMERTFTKNDSLSIVIAPPKGELFSEKYLTLVRDITESAWQTPYSTRVDSISNYQHTQAIEDDLTVADLLPKYGEISSQDAYHAKQIALVQPELVGGLISASGDVAIVNIRVNIEEVKRTEQTTETVAFASTMLNQYIEQYPEVTFHKSGIVMMNNSFFTSAQQDSQTLVPLMFLVVLLVVGSMLRSFSALAAVIIVLVSSIAITLGIAGWFDIKMNTATINVPTIVLTLAVADCVHILSSMRQARQRGREKFEALVFALKINSKPVLITSLTTAIGFLSMNLSDVPAIRELGNLTAVGVMIAWLLSITLLPALLYFLPQRSPKLKNTNDQIMAKLGVYVTTHAKMVMFVSIALIAISTSFITQNRINDVGVEYFDKSNEFRQAADFMSDNISGMSTVSIAIDSGEDGGVSNPEYLAFVKDLTAWLRAQPEVDNVNSLTDVMLRLNKSMHADDVNYYRLPVERELAAQYLLLYEMSLPYGLDLNNLLDISKQRSRVTVLLDNLGSKEMTAFEQRLADWFDSREEQYTYIASSPALMFAHIGERNMQSMLTSLPMALLLISILLVFALRSVRLGAISLLPNILPAVAGFGIWGLYSGEINLGLSVVASLTLGIIVDDTVHFLAKYQYAKREGKSPTEAVQYAFVTVGKALWTTTVVLVAGFGVLAISDFRLNADLGQSTGLVISIALLVDFFLLPAFLVLFDKSKTVEKTDENLLRNAA